MSSTEEAQQFVLFLPGKACCVSLPAFNKSHCVLLGMERAAELAAEVLTLWKLQETSRRLCLAFPKTRNAHSDCYECDLIDGPTRKRKHSEPPFGERDIGVNELLLKD
eukprot:RCo032103